MNLSWFGIARSGALLAIVLSAAHEADARGFGGGGFRGGGSMSMSRGGGFSRGSSSFGRESINRGSTGDRGSKGTFTRGGEYGKPSDSTRPGQGGSGTERPSQLPSGGGGAGNLPGGGGGSGRPIDPGTRPGGGGSGTERPTHPINCPGCGGSGTEGWFDHPIAAGVVIGAAATAAVIGATYYALPPGCPPYYWNSLTYYSCDGIYYAPQYEGDTIVYVTVPDPSEGKQPPAK